MDGLRKNPDGFTLIELLVVVSIIAVILVLVAPSFRQTIEMQRLRGVHDQVITDLQFARSEAARLNLPVHISLRPAADGQAGCYMLYTDSKRSLPFSPACDCREPEARRCTDANTRPLKVVTIPATATGLRFGSAGRTNQVGFDPDTGGRMIGRVDGGAFVVDAFSIETYYDDHRKLRTTIDYSGRPTTCAPGGSSVRVKAC